MVSPELHPQLQAWRVAGRLEHVARPWRDGDCAGAVLAFACTGNRDVNAAVAAEARARGILHNVADGPDAGTFHTLGIVQRGEIQVAVGTGGASPALAALVRRSIDELLGPEYAVLAERMSLLRRQLGPLLEPGARTKLWRSLASPETLQLLRDGDRLGFEQHVDALVAEASTSLPTGQASTSLPTGQASTSLPDRLRAGTSLPDRPEGTTTLPDRPGAIGNTVATPSVQALNSR